jgi:hypothetical protein
MPKRYTFEEVQKIFADKTCVLQSSLYTNQTCKLEYTATCGHINTNTLKDFLNGNGLKCRNCALDIPNYEKLCKMFSDKNCQVTMTSEQFQENYKNNTCKINYIASCGHQNTVSYKNFTTLNQGINCPKCVHKNNSLKLKELYSNGNNLSSLNQEFNSINYFKNLIDNHFIVIKSFDGCKADITIKKFEETEDLWLGIKLKKTIKKTEREQYYFRLNNGKYNNCLILCVCDEDKKMWLIPYEEVNGLKTIGIAKKSKYNKYEVTIENLIEKLNHYYMTISKTQFDILDTPTSIFQQQEQQYRKIREEKVNFVEFKNNNIEGLVYDFKIGEKKVQEKVGTIMHSNNDSYSFNLVKYKCRINGKCKNQCYDEGDNDLYWLNCKNGKFYVIPEEELIVHGYIGKVGKEKLYLSPTNKNTEWCNKYLFNYENIEKNKLLEIINK